VVLEDDLARADVPGVDLAVAPPAYELGHAVPVEVEPAEARDLVLRLRREGGGMT
jgi:hypothetical protein